MSESSLVRLGKYLSRCGITSRRGAEALVLEGRVTLNGVAVEKVATIIDESSDVVKVDGTVVAPVAQSVYIVLNKPCQVMTTLHDPFGRKTVHHCLKNLKQRVYPVGRLDLDTEGVLLLCNDGDLAYRLMHPKYEVEKVYEATVAGRFQPPQAMKIQQGIKLEDGAVGRARADILEYGKNMTRLRLTLTEGRKREVRQLCKAVGHPVKQLRRVRFADLTAKGLKAGGWRHLTAAEVKKLKALVGL